MTRTNKLSLIAFAAALAIPALASADNDRSRYTLLGEVGTHSHDAEDFIPVQTNERFESLELTSEGRGVRLDSILVQYDDGREYRADVNWMLRPGERVNVDIPAFSPIKMLVLEYDNPGRHWRAREDARVEVRGLSAGRRVDRDDRRGGYYQRDRRTDRRPAADTRFEWRAGIYVRVR